MEAVLMPKGASEAINHDTPAHPFHQSVEMETIDRENKRLRENFLDTDGSPHIYKVIL